MGISKAGSSFLQKWMPKQLRSVFLFFYMSFFFIIFIHSILQQKPDIHSSFMSNFVHSIRQSWRFPPLSSILPSQASVKPRCGRMVGFSSGGENPHGVRAVTRGQRCAVALWFTLDPLFRELVTPVMFIPMALVTQATDSWPTQKSWQDIHSLSVCMEHV